MILKNSSKFLVLVGAMMSLSLITACDKGTPKKALTPLEARGKGVFVSNCIACHNPNPTLDGSIGPAIAGSSLDLITHRVLTRDYPPGYKPKRNSEVMPDFPQLKDDVPALHAYLNSFTK
jgi:mono/diheme cytochrome c family protein